MKAERLPAPPQGLPSRLSRQSTGEGPQQHNDSDRAESSSSPSPVLPALDRFAAELDVVERVAPHSIHDVMSEATR